MVLAALAATILRARRRGTELRPQRNETPDPRVRSVAAVPVIAAVALVLSQAFSQPEGAGAGAALAQALPGMAIIAGVGAAYRFLDLRTAIGLAAVITCWSLAYMIGRGGGDPGAALVNALMMLVLIAGAVGISQAAKALRRAGSPAGRPQ